MIAGSPFLPEGTGALLLAGAPRSSSQARTPMMAAPKMVTGRERRKRRSR
jgi:hypothetical protein